MATRDIIVVGGSAGAIDVLKRIVDELPRHIGAAIFAVVHIPPTSPGRLPDILQRRASVRVAWALDGEPIERGRVYVAPADQHMVLEGGQVRLTRGPRENHCRPAIDPLFRSAALAFGPRVIGVVLSGRLDDGTAGLWTVKEHGGIAVVQDPHEAAHADMPRNALEYTAADHVVRSAQIASLLARLSAEPLDGERHTHGPTRELELEVQIAMEANALQNGVMSLGPTTPYTCPECHGVLMRVEEGGIPRFRCHTGHAFALDSLLSSVTETVEETLWSALRAVEETVMLLREAAEHSRSGAPDPRFEEKAREALERAELIRRAVLRHQALSLATIRADVGGEAADD